jgi:excisionase family DNA binding protein
VGQATVLVLMYFLCESSEGKPRMQKETVSVLLENLEKRQRALKVSEVAYLFQVSPMTIYRAAKEGSLPSFKVGSSLRFDPKTVTAWLKRQMGVLNPV